MNDELKPNERDALIRALENDGRLELPNNRWGNTFLARCVSGLRIAEIVREDEVDTSNTTNDIFDRLTDSGRLLAQSLKRERDATAWRPMSKAPKGSIGEDPVEVLLLTGDGDYYVGWRDDYFAHWLTSEGPFQESALVGWLPLPPPPETER